MKLCGEKTIGRLRVMLCLYEFYFTNISMRDSGIVITDGLGPVNM